MRILITLLCLLSSPMLMASDNLQKLIQLVDYVGVDYPEAVENGQIISPEEYGEMLDFSAAIKELLGDLPASTERAALIEDAVMLSGMIDRKAAPATVAALTASMRMDLIRGYNVTVTPRKAPDIQAARQLYSENCAACHGVDGLGDGPSALGLEPAPTNFQDRERASQRSIYGLYSTITHGVDDTAMTSFADLSEEERWSLAFMAAQWSIAPAEMAEGKALLANGTGDALRDLNRITTLSPAEAEAEYGGASVVAYLRGNPELLFNQGSPLQYTRDRLRESLLAYGEGNADAAYRLAVDAYLEGFELAEAGVNAVAPDLRLSIESAMTEFRIGFRDDVGLAVQEQRGEAIVAMLDDAQNRLDSKSLSGLAAFASAFLILLREGLEALLVVAALAAFLVKTGRRDGLPYLHAGWAGALLLGVFTWYAASNFFTIGGAQRELTEGIAAIVAAVVLFYVGFWLHSKTHAAQWKKFIDGSVKKALSLGTLWGLAGLSFIAVYREVFETILFYQALWLQVDQQGQTMTLAGVGAAAGTLAVLAWLVMRYSARLPLRQFFGVTGVFMFVLAVVFAGKGVAALQEAGKLPVNPIDFPRIELLGVYPNMEGLALQFGLVAVALLLMFARSRGEREAAA